MIEDAMRFIKEMALQNAIPKKIEINGRTYMTSNLVAVADPQPDALKIHTLTGLVDYICNGIDGIDPGSIMVQVANYDCVYLFSSFKDDAFKNRAIYIHASHEKINFGFGRPISPEQFIINLQSMFVRTKAVEELLKLAGNLSDGIDKRMADDGISQKATVKTGPSTVGEINVPNPHVLQPYRTFNEIEQPGSPFIFRLHSGPECALYEADGGAWKLEAITRIADWLRERLPEEITIIA